MTQEFKDHIVQHPNRFKRVPVAGTTDQFDMIPTWVENPNEVVQLGTPVNADLMNGLTSQLAEKASQSDVGSINNDLQASKTSLQSAIETARSEQISPNRIDSNSLTADKLRIAANADRIKLANLSDEVLQAMAGTTPVNATPADLSVTEEKVAPGAVTERKTSFMVPGKNLLNHENSIDGQLLSSFNTTVPNALYSTSEYIPVDGNTTYTISKFRVLFQYDADKVGIAGTDYNTGNNQGNYTFTTDANARFIQISYLTTNLTQVEKGSVVTEFEPFAYRIESLDFTESQYQAINDKIKDTIFEASGKAIAVFKSGESFKLVSDFDGVDNIEIETVRNGSSNGSFNITKTSVGDVMLIANTDDITPIRTFTTVGANHGYTNIVVIGMSGHGKVTADLGSQWTDGTTIYTLLAISGNNLTFGCPYTVTDGVVSSAKVNPVSDLTHVSGATNTATISIATISSSPQLYPSINNISVKYILDGKEITEDGTYSGDVLEIQEQYNVMDYKSIIDFAQANIGTSYANNLIEGVVQLTNTFVFRKGLKCTTAHGLKALKKVTLANCGFLQAGALSAAGYARKRFMPGVLPKSGWDFEAGVDLDAYNVSLNFGETDNKVAGVAPSYYTDWLYLSGVRKFGFSMGYIIDKTNTKHADRIALGGTLWDMRSTKKSYPVALKGTLEAGEYRNFMGFRNYLSPKEVGEATTLNVVKDAKDTYLYAHLHTPVTNLSKQIDDRIGGNITALQNDGVTLKNDVVDASGVVISANGSPSNAIIKLT